MSNPAEGESLSFIVGRELSPLEIARFAKYAAKLGLTAQFICPELPNLAREDILQDHLRKTYPPKSQDDYLGKEHFWKLGDEIGVPRRSMAKLFTELCFPASVSEHDISRTLRYGRAHTHASCGLVVRARQQVGLEDPGIAIGENISNGRQMLHRSQLGNELTVRTAVIQIAGILNLEEIEPSPAEFICTPNSQAILPPVCNRLRELTDPQLTLSVDA